MYFSSFSDFLSMGGHGLYVWLCYAVGVLVLSAAFIQPLVSRKQIVRDIQQAMRRAEINKESQS